MTMTRHDLFNLSPRIVLDGRVIRLRDAVNLARANGFKGCDDTIKRRIREGVSTLAELAKPTTPGQKRGASASAERMRRRAVAQRAEIAAIVATLNERKAAMRGAD